MKRLAAATLILASLVPATLAGTPVAAGSPGPDVPSLVVNPDAGPFTSTIAVTAHFPYLDCPMKGDPKVRFQWDGVTLASVSMHGRCDVATTITPLPNAVPGVYPVDAIANDGTHDLVARGMFTLEVPVATGVASFPTSGPDVTEVAAGPLASGGTSTPAGALCLIGVAALVLVGILRWRRASRRRRYPDVGPDDRWISS